MRLLLKKSVTAISIALLVTLTYSCSEDRVEILPNTPPQLEVNFEKLSEISKLAILKRMSDDLIYLPNSSTLIDPNNRNFKAIADQIETIQVISSTINRQNLNDVFSLLDNSITILTLSLLEDDNGDYDGLIIHYTDNQGNLKMDSYRKRDNSGVFEKIDFPANLVTAYTLNNVLYVARNIFPKRNIITIGISNVNDIKSTNAYDDIALLRFASKYDLLKLYDTKKGGRERSQFKLDKQARPIQSPGFEGGGDEPCAIAVHHCNNGTSSRTNCQPFSGRGCIEQANCGYSATLAEMQTNQMTTEYSIFESNLAESSLYNFRDWLNTQPSGQFYNDAYYSMSPHFQDALDVELLYDLTNSSFDMGNFVSAMLSNDQNYVLTPKKFGAFVKIAEKSALKSQSIVYQDLVDVMVSDVQVYRSKNILQIKGLLSE